MGTDKPPRRPTKRCYNCGLACNGMFCCEWCIDTYYARQDAQRAASRRRAQSQPNQGLAPGAGEISAGG
jgi:hypothetical protein